MNELELEAKFKCLLDDFAGELKNIYAEGLISLILYGSAASGEFSGRHSNLNLLVVLENTGLENLSKVSMVINSRKFRLIHPLFFTESYIKNSLDVFPIEFLDIKENFSVLYGRDILTGLEIDTRNLRFQCEQELKSKLLNLKDIYLRLLNKAALKGILFKSANSILHILRNLIRLGGAVPPYRQEEILRLISAEFKVSTVHLEKILQAKKGGRKVGAKEAGILFAGLVGELEKIVEMVDGL
ncbi:MAG: hypothetical protein Q8N85_02085 [Candidatus Omnitrophota bacterium]|nr:hypothetical protein [Candidatus Omnitrophota bacterium]